MPVDEALEAMRHILTERSAVGVGILLEQPTEPPPSFCAYYDRNGDPIDGTDYAADSRAYQARLCRLDRIASPAELDDYLHGRR